MTTRNQIDSPTYAQVVDLVAAMVRDRDAQVLARERGLHILDVTWEDTGRYKGSAVGPNISDMTIQVQDRHPRTGAYRLTCMPVIRTPNFADISADVPMDSFYLLTGNETGQPLHRVTLREYLGNLRAYLTDPQSWTGEAISLLAERDTYVLASAQACFLPIPKQGKAQFNPVLFNYQSYARNPAVLAILATREGASATVIDNQRDAFQAGRTWGQRLFFNQAGERASLTGERASDFVAGIESVGGAVSAAERAGLNMVLLIQVPLKQTEAGRTFSDVMFLGESKEARGLSIGDVEEAAIGHGDVEGLFTEIDGQSIERDARFPIRVTVQFYKATGNGVVSAGDVDAIAEQISRVYREAHYVGSLVVSGDTGRPTEYHGPKQQPPDWWDDFWRRYQQDTGQSPEEAIAMLRRIRPGWQPADQEELRQALEVD
jgi:hypothetical protein